MQLLLLQRLLKCGPRAVNDYHLVALGMLTRINLDGKPCKHFQLSMAMLKKLYKDIQRKAFRKSTERHTFD